MIQIRLFLHKNDSDQSEDLLYHHYHELMKEKKTRSNEVF